MFMGWLGIGLILLILIGIPVGYMLVVSLRYDDAWSLQNFIESAMSPRIRQAAINSLALALGVVFFGALIAIPLSFGVARTNMPLKRTIEASVFIAVLSPDFLMGMAYTLLLGPRQGYLNQFVRWLFGSTSETGPFDVYSYWAVLLILVPKGVAFIYMALMPALRRMDTSLEEAARVAGSTYWQTIGSITARLVFPAFLSGAILAFAVTLSVYGAPSILGYDVLTVAIRQSVLIGFNFELASALSLVLTAVAFIALLGYRRSTREEQRFVTVRGKAAGDQTTHSRRIEWSIAGLGALYAVIAFALPYVALILVSFMTNIGRGVTWSSMTLINYQRIFEEPAVMGAVINSIVLAGLAATIVVPIGVGVSYLVVRGHGRFKSVVDYVAMAPLAIPGTAFGLAIMVVYLNEPFRRLNLYGTVVLILIAYVTHFISFGVRTTQSAVLEIDVELEEASRVFGSTRIGGITRVVIPLLKDNLLYCWALVFVLALTELSASVLLAGPGRDVLSTMIVRLWEGRGGVTAASALGILLIVFIAVTLGLMQAVQRVLRAPAGAAR